MSQEFLSRILEQKARSWKDGTRGTSVPLRESYQASGWMFENHQDRLAIHCRGQEGESKYVRYQSDVDIVQQAQTYEANGAVMISVLTDEVFFKGHLDYLRDLVR